MAHAHVSSGGRYPVLRSVAILFLANAILVVGTGIYWTYNMLTQSAIAMSDRVHWESWHQAAPGDQAD